MRHSDWLFALAMAYSIFLGVMWYAVPVPHGREELWPCIASHLLCAWCWALAYVVHRRELQDGER